MKNNMIRGVFVTLLLLCLFPLVPRPTEAAGTVAVNSNSFFNIWNQSRSSKVGEKNWISQVILGENTKVRIQHILKHCKVHILIAKLGGFRMKTKLMMYILLIMPWLSVFKLGKFSFKRYLPTIIFSDLVIALISELSRSLKWWKVKNPIFPKLASDVSFLFGPFTVLNLWVLN